MSQSSKDTESKHLCAFIYKKPGQTQSQLVQVTISSTSDTKYTATQNKCKTCVSSKLNSIFLLPVIWTILICLQAFSFHFQLQLGHAGVGRLDPTNERNKDNYFKIFILFCLVHCYRTILMAHSSHTSILLFIIIFSFRFNV